MSSEDRTPDWLRTRPRRRPLWTRILTARPGARPQITVTLIVGELLITLGVLTSLYLTWELFWTDLGANAEQAATVAALPWAQAAVPGMPAQAVSTIPTPEASAPPVQAKSTIAVVRIPRFGADYVRPISEGVDKHSVLDALGIGHFPGTAAPGAVGNFATIGHRTTYGKPYNQIADLQNGDQVFVDTPAGRYEYRVYEHLVVLPTQVDVTGPQPGHDRVMTLIACTPKGSASHRYVVHADLVSWTPWSAPAPGVRNPAPAPTGPASTTIPNTTITPWPTPSTVPAGGF